MRLPRAVCLAAVIRFDCGMVTPLVLACIGLWLFLAPLRRHASASARRSLGRMLRDLWRLPRQHGGRPGLTLCGTGVCVSVFLPALVLLLARLSAAGATWWILLAGGLLLLVATAGTWLLITLSRSTFGFGPGQLADATPAARLIPPFLLVAGVVALLGAAVGEVAVWLRGE